MPKRKKPCTHADTIYTELLEDHWRFNYTWQGLDLSTLMKHFGASKEVILEQMRKVAKDLPPPTFNLFAKQTGSGVCKSCGMQVLFVMMKDGKWHPCDTTILLSVVEGNVKKGRQSHFASCPDAEHYRSTLNSSVADPTDWHDPYN